MENLRVKILINNDIIDVINKKVYINSYKATIRISIRPRGEFVRRKIYIKIATIVPSYT